MLRPINNSRRRTALRSAILLCAVPCALFPLAARSSLEIAGRQAQYDTRFSAHGFDPSSRVRNIVVLRDPFVPDRGAPQHAQGSSAVGVRVIQGQSTGYPLPGNGVLVSAIVSGASPRALLDDAGRVRVVGVGDSVCGSRIIGIDAKGLILANGVRISIAEERP